jgi:hypothetical protein
MKKPLDAEEFYDVWLVFCYGITVKELKEKEPELCKTSDWYKKYAVTQEQHDRWYEWAIDKVAKHYRWSKKVTRRHFEFNYLNLAPSVKED